MVIWRRERGGGGGGGECCFAKRSSGAREFNGYKEGSVTP